MKDLVEQTNLCLKDNKMAGFTSCLDEISQHPDSGNSWLYKVEILDHVSRLEPSLRVKAARTWLDYFGATVPDNRNFLPSTPFSELLLALRPLQQVLVNGPNPELQANLLQRVRLNPANAELLKQVLDVYYSYLTPEQLSLRLQEPESVAFMAELF